MFLGLLLITNLLPTMVTLIVDDTPPVFTSTVPENGKTYSTLGTVTAVVTDPESGVREVYCTLLGQKITLSMKSSDTWSAALSYEMIEMLKMMVGSQIDFSFTATNYAGLTKTITGKFLIYRMLSGVWYINNQEITSSTQTIYATSKTVSFKFVKTAGLDDSKISAWVEEGGTKVLTLTYQGSSTWTGSREFTPGRHTITLKASDNIAQIELAILDIDIPGGLPEIPLSITQIIGLSSMFIGVLLIYLGTQSGKKYK